MPIFQTPTLKYCYIWGQVENDDDLLQCVRHATTKIDQMPQSVKDIDGVWEIHVSTGKDFEFLEDGISGTYEQAKKRHNELYLLTKEIAPHDTLTDKLKDNSYIVWSGGIRRQLTITTRKSGKNEGRKLWWNAYIPGDILTINSIDLT